MKEWIILGSAVGLILFAAGVLTYNAVRTKYPDGKKYTMKWEGRRVNLIMDDQAAGYFGHVHELRAACLNAVKAVVRSHTKMVEAGHSVSGSVAPTNKYLKEYTVYVVPDDDMLPNAAAYTIRLDDIETCVMSDKYVFDAIRTGEPIIHELCHVVLNDYTRSTDDHADPTIWAAASDKDTLQDIAQRVYLELHKILRVV